MENNGRQADTAVSGNITANGELFQGSWKSGFPKCMHRRELDILLKFLG